MQVTEIVFFDIHTFCIYMNKNVNRQQNTKSCVFSIDKSQDMVYNKGPLHKERTNM